MADSPVQKPQIIDLNKSHIPTDPNAFPESLIGIRKEDGEEKSPNIIPFEGYNFLPTHYGYKSYFGQTKTLKPNALPARPQFIIPIKSLGGDVFFVALCEGSIYKINPRTDSDWTSCLSFAFDPDVFIQWTYCFIDNILYAYAQGHDQVYSFTPAASTLTFSSFTPNFLNMKGQIGIFKAGTRLGFWDSANSVSWSSTFSVKDFTPSLETLAGNMIFSEVVGRITTILEKCDGFVIYSSATIVVVTFDISGALVWSGKKVLDSGIINPRSVCFGSSNEEHYAFTTAGIIKLGTMVSSDSSLTINFVLPEVFDLLKESRKPVYMDCLNSRYLMVQVFDGSYIYGVTSFEWQTTDPLHVQIKLADSYWDGDLNMLPTKLTGNTMKVVWQSIKQNKEIIRNDSCVLIPFAG